MDAEEKKWQEETAQELAEEITKHFSEFFTGVEVKNVRYVECNDWNADVLLKGTVYFEVQKHFAYDEYDEVHWHVDFYPEYNNDKKNSYYGLYEDSIEDGLETVMKQFKKDYKAVLDDADRELLNEKHQMLYDIYHRFNIV